MAVISTLNAIAEDSIASFNAITANTIATWNGIEWVHGYVIEGSGLFNGSDSVLKRTFKAGNTKIFTVSVIVKFNVGGDAKTIFRAGTNDSTDIDVLQLSSGMLDFQMYHGSALKGRLRTTQLIRDFSAYYHIVVAVNTNAAIAAANRLRMYINGTEVTDFETRSNPGNNQVFLMNSAVGHSIGAGLSSFFTDAYYANVTFIDGLQLTPTSFGETTSDGYWQINDASDLTFGTNGFLLEGGVNMAAGTDSQAGGTPAEQQVITLLHMDGNDAATTFTDSSSYTQTFTAGGNAQIDTAQKKYGTASGLFDGTGDRLVMTASPVFAHGTAWTAEGWFRKSANGNGTEAVYYQGDDHYVFYARDAAQTNSGVSFYFNGTTIAGSTSMTDSNFHHFAMVRDGSTARAFIDGISIGTASPSWATSTASDVVNIGSQNASNYFTGHIDEVRVTTGLARYTSNFTVPSAAFSNPETANHFLPVATITATNDSPTNGDA